MKIRVVSGFFGGQEYLHINRQIFQKKMVTGSDLVKKANLSLRTKQNKLKKKNERNEKKRSSVSICLKLEVAATLTQ